MPPADARRVMSFVVRQITGTDALCEWCLRREEAYWNKFRWSSQDYALAAARDVACYQLARSESDMLITLRAFDEVAAKEEKA